MKVSLYISKKDFDQFFVWMNRLQKGIIQPAPVKYSHVKDDIEDPLHLSFPANEYALIQDTESNIEEIKRTWGNLDILYHPESLENQKILMGDILRNASRHDSLVDLVSSSIELAMHIPGITPLEAMIIAEREWGFWEKNHPDK
jgi:hypothetical protein